MMDYAMETLMIEKYRQIVLERQVEINEHEARTSFGSREIIERIKRLDEAIARLERAKDK